ncbi:MAG: hypothetical protein WBA50_20855, partial [Mycobacterium sp.]
MCDQYANRTHTSARHRRLIGLTSTAGAFLAFGMSPLPAAPAQADPMIDWIVDLFDPASWSWLGAESTAAATDPTTADWFDTWFYAPLHQAGQDWLASQSGIEISTWVNNTFGNGQLLIGNGADGIDGGTNEQAMGGAGGLWFGDGGDGGTAVGGWGGNGGDAGFFGNGGDGGHGGGFGSGDYPGDGGDGGSGGTYMGHGGSGGDGGSGAAGWGGGYGGDGGNAVAWLFGNGGAGGHGG